MPRQKLPAVLWQTGHVDVIRTRTILEQRSLTGRRVRPIMVDPHYCIDIDTAEDLDAAGRALASGTLEIDMPADRRKPTSALPVSIDLVVFDFDGVLTDNRVLVFPDGGEAVACDRGDGLAISRLRQAGIPTFVLSSEVNPVVASRCRKLALECLQGVDDKLSALRRFAETRRAALANTVYVGNDVNDLACLRAVGCAVVPADAHPSVLPHAHIVLSRAGGRGAVRELCDLILVQQSGEQQDVANT
jgi:N-acylneuraminate cytidylyltransferase